MKNFFLVFVFLFSVSLSSAQEKQKPFSNPLIVEDSVQQKEWVDSLYNEMSMEEKIGQLFMVDLFPEKSPKNSAYVETLIKDYHVGGVIFFKGTPHQQATLTNKFQDNAKYPLMMGQDAEWGLAMRLDSTYAFPWNMTLGAIDDNKLLELTGKQIAKHAKRIGVQYDFTPSVDVNINPSNPVIGNRSFGENPKRVAEKGVAFMKGMENEGVLTSAKHFPGHGDTDVDSHKDLPVIDFSRERLDSIELYPFTKMIEAGTSSVMISHLHVPALDNRSNRPASLSKPIMTDLLKNEMGHNGIVISDAMNMKGIANNAKPGEASLQAFKAGMDILLYPMDVPRAIKLFKEAYDKGEITEERLEHSVKQMLRAKYKTGLNHVEKVATKNLVEDLNTQEDDALYAELMENAITLIKNNKAVLPIKELKGNKIAYVPMGDDKGDDFYKTLNKYTQVDKVTGNRLDDVLAQLEKYDQVIIGFHKSNGGPWSEYRFTNEELVWIHEISLKHTTVLDVFTRPYAMLDMRSTTNLDGVLISYQNSKMAQEKSAQIIFGALGAKGRLPVSIGKNFPEGTQFKTTPLDRLSYGLPENVGMDAQKLKKIDSIAGVAVSKKMTPGMQVLVARKGKVVFQKNYGYHTYDKKKKVEDKSVYDLASLTKILATTPLLMELVDQKKLDIDAKLGDFMPFVRGTDKAGASVKESLSHYAQFKAWIPFYKNTLNKHKKPGSKYYSNKKEGNFTVEVVDDLYMRKDYQDSIYKEILDSDLRRRKEYKYSDLPYYLFKRYLEEHYGTNMNQLTQERFLESMGTNRLRYKPLWYFEKKDIVPSEKDDYWRNKEVKGFVNDQGAAMFSGLGGHAGLFGNANDVAKMMQLFMNNGSYGGTQYFKPETFQLFNTCHFCNKDVRRGVGFDKPQKKGKIGPGIDENSKSSFGHTGFTGTMAWADPDEDLIFVVLTNRTYPDPGNGKLIKENIRTKIEKVAYDAIID